MLAFYSRASLKIMNMIHELQFDKWCGEIFFIDVLYIFT